MELFEAGFIFMVIIIKTKAYYGLDQASYMVDLIFQKEYFKTSKSSNKGALFSHRVEIDNQCCWTKFRGGA